MMVAAKSVYVLLLEFSVKMSFASTLAQRPNEAPHLIYVAIRTTLSNDNNLPSPSGAIYFLFTAYDFNIRASAANPGHLIKSSPKSANKDT